MDIKRLDVKVRSLIRASAILPHLHNIVEELIVNSLDAKADNIEVRYDMEKLEVIVTDNGIGISRENLSKYICEEWNATSKSHSHSYFTTEEKRVEANNPDIPVLSRFRKDKNSLNLTESSSSYGFRGEALSAIASLATVEITSREKGSSETYCKRIRSDDHATFGKVHNRSIPSSRHGTKVVLSDIFNICKVRQRNIKRSGEVSKIKDFIVRMSILHHAIGWKLIDNSSNRWFY
jgi:DNA mismatch repair ATPase MutL